MASTKTKRNIGTAVAVGAGVAALSAAAYLLFGPGGEENRRKLRGFALRMKGEILERLEKFSEITEPVFKRVVSEVASKYAAAGEATEEEIFRIAKELERNWSAYASRASASRVTKSRQGTKGSRKKVA